MAACGWQLTRRFFAGGLAEPGASLASSCLSTSRKRPGRRAGIPTNFIVVILGAKRSDSRRAALSAACSWRMAACGWSISRRLFAGGVLGGGALALETLALAELDGLVPGVGLLQYPIEDALGVNSIM